MFCHPNYSDKMNVFPSRVHLRFIAIPINSAMTSGDSPEKATVSFLCSRDGVTFNCISGECKLITPRNINWIFADDYSLSIPCGRCHFLYFKIFYELSLCVDKAY